LLALRGDHWLAKKKQIRCADLSGQNFILCYRRDGKSPLDDHRKAILEKGAFRLEAVQKAPGFITVIGLVAAGSGVALVPESFHYMKLPSVVFRPLADIELVSELAVAYRRDERSPAVRRFLADLSTENFDR
jgi:DNA-binding transcriptional LysR family regulator